MIHIANNPGSQPEDAAALAFGDSQDPAAAGCVEGSAAVLGALAESTAQHFSSRSSSPQPACLSPQPSCLSPEASCLSSQPSEQQALPEPVLQLHDTTAAAWAPASLLPDTALQDPDAQECELGPTPAERLQAVLAAASLQREACMSDESDSDYASEDSEDDAPCCTNCTSRLDDDFCEVRKCSLLW